MILILLLEGVQLLVVPWTQEGVGFFYFFVLKTGGVAVEPTVKPPFGFQVGEQGVTRTHVYLSLYIINDGV